MLTVIALVALVFLIGIACCVARRHKARQTGAREEPHPGQAECKIETIVTEMIEEAQRLKLRQASPETLRTKRDAQLNRYRAALDSAGISGTEAERKIQGLLDLWRSVTTDNPGDISI